jgi:putative ABC transport system ATP-binding protein
VTEGSAPSSIIRCADLWRTYQMGEETIHALRGVSFDIQANEYLAIMGPSGSGKSTLMNLIGCLDTPSKGEYYLRGQLVSKMTDDALAEVRNREIGFVFQTFNLLPRASALENVELPLVYAGIPKAERIERARQALEKVELGSRMGHKPNELSGGQRQRVAIARALANDPLVILADEPTGNLDTHSSGQVLSIMRNLVDSSRADHAKAIVIVTHDLDLAAKADRRVHIVDGRIEAPAARED